MASVTVAGEMVDLENPTHNTWGKLKQQKCFDFFFLNYKLPFHLLFVFFLVVKTQQRFFIFFFVKGRKFLFFPVTKKGKSFFIFFFVEGKRGFVFVWL